MTSKQEMKQEKRDNRGRFLPGVCGNPGGRPSEPSRALMEITRAIEEFKKEKGVSYWKAATLIAMKLANEGNATLLGKIMDKYIPSKIQGEGFGNSGIYVYIVKDGHTGKRDSDRIALPASPEPADHTG